jgi:hypothetical protein
MLKESIERYLSGKNAPHVKKPRVGPSEIGCNCPREAVMNRLPEYVAQKQEFTMKQILVFLTGTAVHEYFQKEILPKLEDYELVEAERFIETEQINGFIDAIVKEKATGLEWVVELKTANAEKFAKMAASGKPEQVYVDQATLYMGVTGIHRASVFVINKDGAVKSPMTMLRDSNYVDPGIFLEFTFDFDPALYEKLLSKVSELYGKIAERDKDLPPRVSSNPNKFPCLWCGFNKVCHPDAYAELDFYNGEVPPYVAQNFPAAVQKFVSLVKAHKENALAIEAAAKDLKGIFYTLGKRGNRIRGKNSVVVFDNESLRIEMKKAERANAR